jgi:hypothetical protein
MKNQLARNPRRNPKLSRNKKIGIALVSVAAVGGVTAAVIAMRRKPKRTQPFCPPGVNGQPMLWNDATQQCEPVGGGQGGSGPSGEDRSSAFNRAKRRFCINPQALSLEQRMLLQEQVFVPLLMSMDNPNNYENVVVIAAAALDQLCNRPYRATTSAMASELAQRTWENYTGGGG